MVNETLGVLLPDGNVYPCFLTGYKDTINSIEKCRRIPHRFLSLPHRGIANKEETESFFEKVLAANIACYEFILNMNKKGLSEDEMMESLSRQYKNETLLKFQPEEAFTMNARAVISCVLREKPIGQPIGQPLGQP